MNSVVFIEGVSGVGKSTTAALLCDKLRNMGYNVDIHTEGRRDNPLDPFNGTYPPAIPLTAFLKTYLQCWQEFAQTPLEKDYILVLDGTLLHHQINDLMRGYRASCEVIADHISNLLLVIKQKNPIVFYLAHSDIGQRLIQAHKSRNQPSPTEEQIAFWEKRKRVDLFVLDRLSDRSHILNIDSGWDVALEKMTTYVIDNFRSI